MEIGAKVYAVADDEALLGQVHEVLKQMTFWEHLLTEELEPCAVLPLSKTWYGFTERAEPTGGPEEWLGCLRECAAVLMKHGAVVVEFHSPDWPEYQEFAYTTSRGDAGHGKRYGMIGYERALGNRDIGLAIDELFLGRYPADRLRECRRLEKKEKERQEKGDFEITPDGVLVRYRGDDTEVVIPDGVRVIGESAFVDMKGVERMIMECEDYDAPAMETVVIPDSVEEIRFYAFAYCANLKEVYLPDSVRVLGGRAFEGCEALRKVRLPEGLSEIDEFTFFLCWALKSISIPESVKRIGEGAFMDCPLGAVRLPEKLESIGKEAFRGCRLKKAVIPESVREIGNNAFPKETEIIREGKGDQ